MNKLNVLFSTLTAVLIMLSTACGGGGESSSSDNPIVGEWKVVKAEGAAASSNEGMEYVFEDDGKAKVGSGVMSTEYTYTTEGDLLTMNYQGGDKIVLTWKFKIDGNKMTMENTTDESQKFELEK